MVEFKTFSPLVCLLGFVVFVKTYPFRFYRLRFSETALPEELHESLDPGGLVTRKPPNTVKVFFFF